MKKIIICFLLALSTSVMADPVMPGLKQKIKLQDGSIVTAELRGDEFAHYYYTEDGQLFRHADDMYVETTLEDVRKTARDNRLKDMAADMASTQAKALLNIKGQKAPTVGRKKGLIILVEFPNKQFSMENPQDYYNRMANMEGFEEGKQKGSLADYFRDQSKGKFILDFIVKGPYKMPNDYQYYGKDSDTKTDVNVKQMITQAISRVSNDVEWSELDWDNDGYIEQVYVIYAGEGQSTGGGADTVWPHKSRLSSIGNPYDVPGGRKVDVYACSNEMRSSSLVAGIGTICHEFSHCLGYADLYDISGNDGNQGAQYGMGTWDLMASGSHNGDGYCPPNYSAYEKWFAGWIEPVVLDTNHYTGKFSSATNNGKSFIVYNDVTSNEFIMMEYRDQTGWDKSTKGDGLMIMHIDYDATVFHTYNCPNTIREGVNDHQRLTIYHADNTWSTQDESTDLFPLNWKDQLSINTNPPIVAYNKKECTSNLLNVKISRIKKHDDGTMSFFFGDPEKAGKEFIFAESFDDCKGTGANDGNWLTLKTATATFMSDHEGWMGSYMRGGSFCARFGSSASNATIVSPLINFTGDNDLYFKVAPFATKEMNLTITSDNPNVSIENNTVNVKPGQWTEVTLKIKGEGSTKLTFAPDSPMYLDDILVTDNLTSDIDNIAIDNNSAKQNGVYSLSGQHIAKNLSNLPAGIYIVNGKKVIVK